MSFLFVVYIPMKTNQQQEVPSEVKLTILASGKADDVMQVATDAPGVITPNSVQPKVSQPATAQEDDDDFSNDEIRPVYRAQKPPETVVVRAETKAVPPVRYAPDVDDEDDQGSTESHSAPLDEVPFSLPCLCALIMKGLLHHRHVNPFTANPVTALHFAILV